MHTGNVNKVSRLYMRACMCVQSNNNERERNHDFGLFGKEQGRNMQEVGRRNGKGENDVITF